MSEDYIAKLTKQIEALDIQQDAEIASLKKKHHKAKKKFLQQLQSVSITISSVSAADCSSPSIFADCASMAANVPGSTFIRFIPIPETNFS